MSLMKVIARYAPAIGAILLGPVSTMIMFPEKFADSYVFGAIDGLLVAFAITFWFNESSTTSHKNDVGGSSRNENEEKEWRKVADECRMENN